MDFFFVLLTQITNLTLYAVDFQVDHHPRRFLPKLRAGETRYAQTSRVRRRIAASDTGWKIRVLLDGEFTGLELDPTIMIHFVRVVFRFESNVLYVEGVREIVGFKDLVLRHRYFGWMRNYSWNGRKPVLIDRSDSSKATKNRKGLYCQHLAPFVDIQKSSSPQKENPKSNKRNPPTVEETLEEKTVRPTSMNKDDRPHPPMARNLPPRVRSGEGVKLRDVVAEAPKPGRVKGDHEESPAIPRVRSREQVRPRNLHKPPNPSSGMATRQQARLRDDEPMIMSPQVRTEGDKPRPLKLSNLQRGGMATGQQARLRSDESSTKPPSPQVRPGNGGMTTGQQARLRDDESSAGPPSPQARPSPSLQHGGMATGQRARLRDDEASANPGEMDSFVRGILLIFALTVCVLMKFFVFGLTVTNVLKT